MPVSTPFAKILAADRAQFNTRIAEAKRRSPNFESAVFSDFLATAVDCVVAAVAQAVPHRAAAVAAAAFDIALTLTAQKLTGPGTRREFLDRVWIEVLPLYARQAADAPDEVLGALSNAALYLESNPSIRGDEWIRHMTELAPDVSNIAHLLALGKVLVWRAGAAHFRSGALTAASRLPESLALAAVGATSESSWSEILPGFQSSPWWSPKTGNAMAMPEVREIGSFVGFGGSFQQPPDVRANSTGFLVKSQERYSLLVADIWGTQLHPATAEEFLSTPTGAADSTTGLKGARLTLSSGTIDINLPPEGLKLASNEHTAAVTSPYSHSILLFPLK